MNNQNNTADIATAYDGMTLPEPIELLDESEHHNSQVLTKKLNEVIVALNKSK